MRNALDDAISLVAKTEEVMLNLADQMPPGGTLGVMLSSDTVYLLAMMLEQARTQQLETERQARWSRRLALASMVLSLGAFVGTLLWRR